MTKNTKRGILVLVLIAAVFNVIAFAVPFAKTPVFWLGYAFGMVAILFQAYIFKFSFSRDGDAKRQFYGFPVARVGVYYLVIQLIVSLLEMAFSGVLPLWAALIVNALIVALAVIGCITTDAMRDEIVRQDGQLKRDISRMRELQSFSASLVDQCSNVELKGELIKVADAFRFSDPLSSVQTITLEQEMKRQIGELQQSIMDDDFGGVKELCSKLLGSLRERNRICLINK